MVLPGRYLDRELDLDFDRDLNRDRDHLLVSSFRLWDADSRLRFLLATYCIIFLGLGRNLYLSTDHVKLNAKKTPLWKIDPFCHRHF